MNQFPPALSVPSGPLKFFTKIRVDIRDFVFSPVLLTSVIKPCPGFFTDSMTPAINLLINRQ
jgi:hypothetical protein